MLALVLMFAGCALAGEYGSHCAVNSDCKHDFVCSLNTCGCDSSHMYDMNMNKCKKICEGSVEGLAKHGTTENQYQRFKQRYTNCSYVEGNLELTNLEKQFDLSFLRHIEEVDGYVLIVNVFSSYLHLRNLRIIRGNTLYKEKYSLFVALNHNPNNDSEGLLELQFTSLKEIMHGQAYFHKNNLLCFVNSIRWDDINLTTEQPSMTNIVSTNQRKPCEQCDPKCYSKVTGDKHCWGKGPDMCQELNYIKGVCSIACDGRCFGPLANQCCHSECAVGCTSQRNSDCVTCKNFYNEGKCLPVCPKMTVYNSNVFRWVKNPAGRYSFKSMCVKDCPSFMLKDNGACVLQCPHGKTADIETNECQPCEETCPKKCKGIPDTDFLHAENIQSFKGCNIVEGNMKILKVSFTGDSFMGIDGIQPDDLWLLNDIKEITGFLNIQDLPPTVKTLFFFSQLEVIHGRFLSAGNAFIVLQTNINFLGLTSLRKIGNGNVAIARNQQLCYLDSLNFSFLFDLPGQYSAFKTNKQKDTCVEEGHVCDKACSNHGCWGPGSDKCLQCKTMELVEDNVCVESCGDVNMTYQSSDTTCKRCHDNCNVGCTGPDTEHCIEIKKGVVKGLTTATNTAAPTTIILTSHIVYLTTAVVLTASMVVPE